MTLSEGSKLSISDILSGGLGAGEAVGGLTCFRDFLIIGWGLSSSSEKARVRGSKSRPDEAIESATRDKPYCIRDESPESGGAAPYAGIRNDSMLVRGGYHVGAAK